jgi:acyl-homoserine-lactone acylase
VTKWTKRVVGAFLTVVMTVGGLATASAIAADPDGPLQATIRRTSHGIPHITASDFGGVGFGYGYAAAEDNICVLADIYTTVNGERSKYSGSSPLGSMGPNGSWRQGGNGTQPGNLNSDFFFQRIKDRGTIENLLSLPPPVGPLQDLKEGVRGYVQGYNKYLRDTGVNNLPDLSCRGKPWVREITEMDAYRRFYQLGLIASQGVAIDGIGGAAPLAPGAPIPPLPTQEDFQGIADQLPLGGVGSNAVALGTDATFNGKGMMLGNPHFPWDGSERFYESQLTIPGKINVEGGSLLGVPIINIGHTDNLAWSHTVSTAYRFTPFELKLVPGDPYSYLYDGQVEHMRAENVTIQVRNADNTVTPQTRTLYSTQPHSEGGGGGYSIFNDLLGIPLPWTPTTAWAMGDANAGNFRYLNHFFEVNDAQSVNAPGDEHSLVSIIKRYQGVPWVNTIASDRSGDAYYADISVTPKVTDEEADACNSEVGHAAFAALGLPFLDGSLSTCEWASPLFGGPDPDAIDPGTFGPSSMPELHPGNEGIRDYVTNSNDSYWLSNPEHPLEGFDRIIGSERTERSLRTRSGLKMVEEELGGPSGSGTFTRQELQDMVFADRQQAGELWRDDLADFCEAAPGGQMTGSNGPVDVSEACPVLRNWDLHDNLDSNGAILFRRFASRALGAVPVVGTPGLYTTPFDANDAVHTPSGLNVANPVVEQSFADAVDDLNSVGIPLDAPLDPPGPDVWQYEKRGSQKIPIHGGPGDPEGVFNAINVGWDSTPPDVGYTNVPHGSSFVMVASFTDDPCPNDTRTILTYSQSTNPDSPWFKDQTEMFSNKQWVDEAFCESEIAADPNLTTSTISEATGYARPKAATPVSIRLIPAFEQCTSGNATHGAPLAVPSCKPPVPASDYLTVGTPDVNGKAPNFTGSITLHVAGENPIDPDNGDQADVGISASFTDVRKASDLTDYTGELSAVLDLRTTDHNNGISLEDPATAMDTPLRLTIPCTATGGTEGSNCNIVTTADAVRPNLVTEGQRAVWELGQVKVYDGGADGDAETTGDNTLFAVQGTFAP